MEAIKTVFQQVASMQWSDYLDILIVAFLIYQLLPLLRTTNAMRIFGVVIVFIGLSLLTEVLHLNAFNFIMDQFLAIGLLALVILFQPELRRMLDHLSNVRFKGLFGSTKADEQMDTIISQTVKACEVMSRQKIGALIVFARNNRLDEFFKTGTQIDGQVSEQLIRNIFFPKAALHDGAMIIRDGRVAAAGCVLPLSESDRLSADLGTRHRAGVGMSENSDAVVVIVSEETGTISVAVGGMLKRHLASQTLEKLLHNELNPEKPVKEENTLMKALKKLQAQMTKKEDHSNEK